MLAGLYGVADPTFGDPLAQVRILAAEGVTTVQLRCKGWPTDRLVALARACPPVRLVLDDDVAAARAVGAWVHVGQDDGPDPDLPFGRSTHTLEQVRAAGSATYIGYGPVFGTSTKETGWTPRGIERLAGVVRASPVPVVAIGGITLENIDAVRATGVAAWAVISEIWRADDPAAVIRAMR